jgi:hypothetical protein
MVALSILFYRIFGNPSDITSTDIKDAALAIFTGFGISVFYTFSEIVKKGSIDYEKVSIVMVVTVSISIVLVICYLMFPTFVMWILGT